MNRTTTTSQGIPKTRWNIRCFHLGGLSPQLVSTVSPRGGRRRVRRNVQARSAWTILLHELAKFSQAHCVGNGRRYGVREHKHFERPAAHDVDFTTFADGGEDLARDLVGFA